VGHHAEVDAGATEEFVVVSIGGGDADTFSGAVNGAAPITSVGAKSVSVCKRSASTRYMAFCCAALRPCRAATCPTVMSSPVSSAMI